MNYYYSLPDDILIYIQYIIKSYSITKIIKTYKRYIQYKKFIYSQISNSPVLYSIIDNDLIYDVTHPFTYFYFKQFNKIINGRESYFNHIYTSFYVLAVSIDDYEWAYGVDNFYYSFNKFFCTSTAYKFNWGNILHMLS
jgi:hypothetical protein